ncbi:Rad59p Ecym_3280 [Eremothecium cymbalariae DBVPG|uniref:DNA repair protein RAD59 n=1 Tax=Eremothecium cymbalariae (strain CBS 270.75 / DBVPG 7215 / KCTC 17166 / NRRL Y-17582) TaxID=931890 RepID=G8JRK4_ERECY|nr:Hypothetical protein Ecym_3280 [Eremothecium cymbalariae DBVPG\
MSDYTEISWDNVEYHAGNGVTLTDFPVIEDWYNRPASKWSMRSIGVFQSKIEQYTYKIYHANKYGKHNLSKLIPGYLLIQFANESFGYNGWSSSIVDIAITKSITSVKNDGSGPIEMHTVTAEARVKLVLQDGTNTEASGFSNATMSSKLEAYGKAKKEAINDALKKCLLSFEQLLYEHEEKVAKNFYTDGLYGSKVKLKSDKPQP